MAIMSYENIDLARPVGIEPTTLGVISPDTLITELRAHCYFTRRYFDKNFLSFFLSPGLMPIAIIWPLYGSSLSMIGLNSIPAEINFNARSLSSCSSVAWSAMAYVPSGKSPGEEAPAAWISCAA